MTQPLPQNRETEEALLGSVILNPSVYFDVAYINSSDFFLHRHGLIWDAITSLVTGGKGVDLLTIGERLEERAKLKEVGGPAFLTELITRVPTSLHAADYADSISKDAARRRLIRIGTEVVRGAYEDGEPDALITTAMAQLLAGTSRRDRSERINIDDVLDRFLQQVANPVEFWGIRMGLEELDKALGGLHRGEVFMLAGDPGVGKTTLVCQLGFQMAGVKFWPGQRGDTVPGVIYSLEMNTNTVIRRAACALARVDWFKVMSGRIGDTEHKSFIDALEVLRGVDVFITDATHWTTTTMRADVARLVAEHGVGWVVVDYAGLLKDQASSDYEKEVIVSKALHDIAKDCNVAVLMVETLNKPGLTGQRGFASIKGAGQKSYDADVVAMMTAEKTEGRIATPERVLYLLKAREADNSAGLVLLHRGGEKRLEPKARPVNTSALRDWAGD